MFTTFPISITFFSNHLKYNSRNHRNVVKLSYLVSDFLFLPITPEIDDPEDNPLLPIKDVTTESSVKEEVSSELNSDDKIKQLKRKKSLKKNSKSKKNKI